MSREKYPEFFVTRTSIRRPKKRRNTGLDGDGLCEYSYIQCVHCDDEIELLSSSLKQCKAGVVRDHLCVCAGYTGERPTKRGSKAVVDTSTALVPYQCTNPAHSTLAEDVKRLTEKIEQHEKRLNQHEGYFYDLAGALKIQSEPPVDPPCLIEEVGVRERERLLLKDSSTTPLPETESLVQSQRVLIDQQSKEYASQLQQKDDQIAVLECERDQKQREIDQKEREIERLKIERRTMEVKFKAQLKTRPSKSLLAQTEESHKQHKRSRTPSQG